LAAVHELLDNRGNGIPEREPCISKELLMSVTRKARPSTPADEKRRYDREFGEFVSSRKSISTKARESKGKKSHTSLSLSNTSASCEIDQMLIQVTLMNGAAEDC